MLGGRRGFALLETRGVVTHFRASKRGQLDVLFSNELLFKQLSTFLCAT